jgi:hypothetical protein
LIFATPGLVADLAGFSLKEDQLHDPFVGVDAAIGTGGVRKF